MPKPEETLSQHIDALNSVDFIDIFHQYRTEKRLGANSFVTFATLHPLKKDDENSLKARALNVVISEPDLDDGVTLCSDMKADINRMLLQVVLDEQAYVRSLLQNVDTVFLNKELFCDAQGRRVFALAKHGDLFVYLENLKPKLTSSQLKEYIAQIVLAVFSLHVRNIVHGDIKPENILVFVNAKGEVHLKLADLDTIKYADQAGKFAGTEIFIAPEIAIPGKVKCAEGKYVVADKKAIDCYVLGCTLEEIMKKCRAANSELAQDESLIDLVKKLKTADPKARLDIDKVMDHPYFAVEGLEYFPGVYKKFKPSILTSHFPPSLVSPPIKVIIDKMIALKEAVKNKAIISESAKQQIQEINKMINAVMKNLDVKDDEDDKKRFDILKRIHGDLDLMIKPSVAPAAAVSHQVKPAGSLAHMIKSFEQKPAVIEGLRRQFK